MWVDREESIYISRALKQYMRVLERKLDEARKAQNENDEKAVKYKLRKCTRIVRKAGAVMKKGSRLFFIVSDEFRA
jgi:hypothetical protein